MRRGRLLAARRAALVVALALSLCTAGQAVSPPIAKARTLPAAAISVGTTHACAIISGAAYCWGSNSRGELGDGSTNNASAPVAVTGLAGKTMAEITAGQDFTCALDNAGAAYCWGDNLRGELGQGGDPDNYPHPIPVEVVGGHVFTTISAAAVGYHVCALDTDGKAWCWGLNSSGQLGCGPITTPPDLACPSLSTAPVEVRLPGATSLTQISTGNDTTCALDNAGHAWCWGANGSGQLGANPSPGSTSLVPVEVTTAPNAPLGNLVQVTVGIGFACAVDSAGAGRCWGLNGNGQLGIGSTGGSTSVPTPVSQGDVPTSRTLAQITAGDRFACALDSVGAAYCWGLGDRGQTGDARYTTRDTPIAVLAALPTPLPYPPYPFTEWPPAVLEGVTLTQISAGESFACAMDGVNVYCWGDNNVSVGMGGGIGAPPGFSPLPVQVAFAAGHGVLSIMVPDTASLGVAQPGGTPSGPLGTVEVIDSRGTGGSWTVTVSATDFTSGVAPAPVRTIPATAVTYTIAGPPDAFTGVDGTPPTNHARPPGITFGTAAAPPALPGNDIAVVTGSGTLVASWSPTISVAVPQTAVVGTYTATITHSVT